MTMTSEQIDEFARSAKACLDAGLNYQMGVNAIDTLATALKSAIQDSARVAWMQEFCPRRLAELSNAMEWNQVQTLRDAIDTRMKGEGA